MKEGRDMSKNFSNALLGGAFIGLSLGAVIGSLLTLDAGNTAGIVLRVIVIILGVACACFAIAKMGESADWK